ncbi:putative colicin V production protein [Caenibius tardaugens NBRC 16725]|uniref:Putative colicin V production protein n=1 Tax=Caenibius tardaugens NBRC 16725 TaxID=1219035 RepID=U2YLM4_9SPHN|nr:CvpA family protein [Caenibius tardaugens]AZI37851.1 CvpA family protein [Caenibius tardaugens NBRC 16725]GAD49570.1 putative colicin V production protein [Caenibius tardaugens NBRC 16725]
MTGFDIIVLLLIGIGAIGGFLRGFVQESLTLCAWILTLFVIHALHTPVTAWLAQHMGNGVVASLVAFAFLLIVPYAAIKLIAKWLGNASRSSVLGPVDRVLGFGFGALKGIIIAVLAFSILALGYDTVWGVAGRPTWITTARTYPFITTASDELVQMIKERRISMGGTDQNG